MSSGEKFRTKTRVIPTLVLLGLTGAYLAANINEANALCPECVPPGCLEGRLDPAWCLDSPSLCLESPAGTSRISYCSTLLPIGIPTAPTTAPYFRGRARGVATANAAARYAMTRVNLQHGPVQGEPQDGLSRF